ncbi:hypothetical protein VNO77_39114 [Canavalia gladiata]|uniref:Uncharacterized protein n=1 Tax=Canavalia gladiata TaxID=3824 RepID=A0AAN9PXZ0_CANGL
MLRYASEEAHYLLYIYDLKRIALFSLPKESKSSNILVAEVYNCSYDVYMQLYQEKTFDEVLLLRIYGSRLQRQCKSPRTFRRLTGRIGDVWQTRKKGKVREVDEAKRKVSCGISKIIYTKSSLVLPLLANRKLVYRAVDSAKSHYNLYGGYGGLWLTGFAWLGSVVAREVHGMRKREGNFDCKMIQSREDVNPSKCEHPIACSNFIGTVLFLFDAWEPAAVALLHYLYHS